MNRTEEKKKNKIKRAILFSLGLLFLFLASLGVFLPLLPTTPFLLLSTACFIRSSQKMYDYVTNHRVFGTYITNYEKGVMNRKDKRRTLIILWAGIGLSIYFVDRLFVRIILGLIALGVTIHLNMLKSV